MSTNAIDAIKDKFCTCGKPATHWVRDFREIPRPPSDTFFTEWEALPHLRFGCEDHTVRSISLLLDGTTIENFSAETSST